MRIGIITMFYNSINYGGNLQAYALCKYLKKRNVDVEQIQFDFSFQPYEFISRKEKINKILQLGFSGILKKIFKKIISIPKKLTDTLYQFRYKNEYLETLEKRRDAFKEFNRNIIPHCDQVYNLETINNCIDDYDVFITGSDQVWNFSAYNPAYYLDFVPSHKVKASYAASISMNSLTTVQQSIVQKSLKNYAAISVREESAVKLLDDLTEQEVQLVVDPTLLLSEEDWDEVTSERLIDEDYVFCYFLGSNTHAYKLAREYADEKNIKLINIPYASGGFFGCNRDKGDISLEGISPQDFLALIKYSTCVFTDSFHAVVFSFLFKKEFFVFNRDSNGSMSTRIENITKLFEAEERFCKDKNRETIGYINSLKAMEYSKEFEKFDSLQKKSYEYIESVVESCIN